MVQEVLHQLQEYLLALFEPHSSLQPQNHPVKSLTTLLQEHLLH